MRKFDYNTCFIDTFTFPRSKNDDLIKQIKFLRINYENSVTSRVIFSSEMSFRNNNVVKKITYTIEAIISKF